jgi:hypothetical protein
MKLRAFWQWSWRHCDAKGGGGKDLSVIVSEILFESPLIESVTLNSRLAQFPGLLLTQVTPTYSRLSGNN